MLLGNIIESALERVGINPQRVEEWLGKPCHCEERKEKLNQLSLWAGRIIQGRVRGASCYLARIIGGEP